MKHMRTRLQAAWAAFKDPRLLPIQLREATPYHTHSQKLHDDAFLEEIIQMHFSGWMLKYRVNEDRREAYKKYAEAQQKFLDSMATTKG